MIPTGLCFDFSLFSRLFFSSLFPGTLCLWLWDLLSAVLTSFPDQICFFFCPLLHPPDPSTLSAPRLRHALLPYSLSPFLPLLLYSPSFISHFSWTPPMRYSIYRHRYGRLSLLTVSSLIPSRSLPVPSSVPSSLSDQQVGRLPLCGLRSLNVQYGRLINAFVLFPLGNKAM